MPNELKQAQADEGPAIAELLQQGAHAVRVLGLLIEEGWLPHAALRPTRRALRDYEAAAKRYKQATAGRRRCRPGRPAAAATA